MKIYGYDTVLLTKNDIAMKGILYDFAKVITKISFNNFGKQLISFTDKMGVNYINTEKDSYESVILLYKKENRYLFCNHMNECRVQPTKMVLTEKYIFLRGIEMVDLEEKKYV